MLWTAHRVLVCRWRGCRFSVFFFTAAPSFVRSMAPSLLHKERVIRPRVREKARPNLRIVYDRAVKIELKFRRTSDSEVQVCGCETRARASRPVLRHRLSNIISSYTSAPPSPCFSTPPPSSSPSPPLWASGDSPVQSPFLSPLLLTPVCLRLSEGGGPFGRSVPPRSLIISVTAAAYASSGIEVKFDMGQRLIPSFWDFSCWYL